MCCHPLNTTVVLCCTSFIVPRSSFMAGNQNDWENWVPVKPTEIDCSLNSPLKVVKWKYLKCESLFNLVATVKVSELFHLWTQNQTALLTHIQDCALLSTDPQGKPTFSMPEVRNSWLVLHADQTGHTTRVTDSPTSSHGEIFYPWKLRKTHVHTEHSQAKWLISKWSGLKKKAPCSL